MSAELRQLRSDAHQVFDRLWRQRFVSRSTAYSMLQGLLGLSADVAHFGNLTHEQLETVVATLKKLDSHPDRAHPRDCKTASRSRRLAIEEIRLAELSAFDDLDLAAALDAA